MHVAHIHWMKIAGVSSIDWHGRLVEFASGDNRASRQETGTNFRRVAALEAHS